MPDRGRRTVRLRAGRGRGGRARRRLALRHLDAHAASCALAEAKLLVPVVPPNFYAAGLNYRAHVEWSAKRRGATANLPAQPDVGYRSANALVPSGADIVIPRDSTGPVEYEGEIVAVVGRRAKTCPRTRRSAACSASRSATT